ncbi:M48 family metalloprotease [Methylotenera sp.]|uniref:beta-barrel assembly-enhancing protease n=1 Tax=Methylotenera sp. TaxID=2051956 RepID=UPI00248750E2|nr:M48 family metalloprotease [Methylotenera sp.]MDI1298311.1 M48 family metalloprotease [Methylotenera sp.]
MKLKTIVIAILLITNSALATNLLAQSYGEPVLTGKPYEAPRSFDLSLPELGDVSQTVLTPLDERRIGEQIMRDVSTSDEVVQDVEIIDYLNNLGNRLVSASSDKQQKFNFFVVQDNSINAFAMPGGVVGVHTGLILATNNESELASVLGHEIGHVTQHHMARMLASQKYDTFKNIAGIALALLVARANPDLASGALTTSAAVGIQNQLDYTRDHEREADRVGLQILDSGGFDVRAMPAFFTTLQRGTRFAEGGAPSFLRTHPLTSERIADVANRVSQMSYRQVPDSVEFQYVRAKIIANNGSADTNIEVFKQNISEHKYTNEAAEHYGLAVAYLRKNALPQAEKEVAWLKKYAPQHAMIENLSARLQVVENNPQQAAEQYAAALKLYPDNRALIYGYADHFLAIKQADSAIKLIKDKQGLYPNDAQFYDVLAKAYTMQNKLLLSYQAQGEAYFRKYDLARAIEQMELAVKANDGDFYQKSIVEARLTELRRLQGEVKKG